MTSPVEQSVMDPDALTMTTMMTSTDNRTTIIGNVFVTSSQLPVDDGTPEGAGRGSGAVVAETVTLVIMWLFAMFGNILVCIVIHRSRRLQSTTNYFVVTLATADICLSVLCMPFVLGRIIANRWIFGLFMCKVVRFVQFLVPGTTMFVFVSICMDRYYTIIYPMSFKVTRCRAKQMIFSGIIVPAVLALPALYFFELEYIDNILFCKTYLPNTWDGIVYMSFIFVLEYVIPTGILVWGYLKIFKHIWRVGIGGHTFQRTTNPVPRAKAKIIKMLIIVNVTNVLLTLPYFAVQLWHCTLGVTDGHVDPSIYIAMIWVYFSTCVTKPGIYTFSNSNFRRGCKEVFCMSTMKCYRSHAYTITTASKMSKKNYVGTLETSSPRDYVRVDSPTLTFDQSGAMDKNTWHLATHMPNTYL